MNSDSDTSRIGVLFTLLGFVGAILPANIYYVDPQCMQVPLEKSLGWAILGGFCGNGLGVVVGAVCQEKPRARAVVLVLAVVLLTTSLGAATGWAYGNGTAMFSWQQGPLTRLGLALGGSMGLVLGVLCETGHVLWQRKHPAGMICPGAKRGLLAATITGAKVGAASGLGVGVYFASLFTLFDLVVAWWDPQLNPSSSRISFGEWLMQFAAMIYVPLVFFTVCGILIGLVIGTFQTLFDYFECSQ